MAGQTVQEKAIAKLAANPKATDYRLLLHEAAEKGWTDVVQRAIEDGEDRKILLNRLLAKASKFGRDHADTVRVILKAGGDPNSNKIMQYCGVQSLPLLIEGGGDIEHGQPLLTAIIERTKQDKALALINAGASVNVADEEGMTATMHAAALGRTKVFDALVAKGADLFAVDKTGRSLIRHIAEKIALGRRCTQVERKNAGRIARKLRNTLPSQPEDQILIHLIHDDGKELEKLLTAGLDPNTALTGSWGMASTNLQTLKNAIKKMNGGLLEALMSGDLFPDLKGMDAKHGDASLLMWATAMEQRNCMSVLLAHGADATRTNKAGVSARSIASEKGKPSTILNLINSGEEAYKSQTTTNSNSAKSSTTNKRTQRRHALNISEKDLKEEIASAEVKWIDWESNLENPRNERIRLNITGSLIQKIWNVACLHHAANDDGARKEACKEIMRVSRDYFSRDNFEQLDPHSKTKPSDTTISKQELSDWSESFNAAIASSAAMGDWKLVDEIFAFVDVNCDRGEKSAKWNPDWYEWPLWVHLGAVAREEEPETVWLRDMKKQSTRRSKAVLSAFEAIENKSATKAQKAIGRIIKAHIASFEHGVHPWACVSPQATFFLHLARKNGLEVEIEDDGDPYIIEQIV